jgi:hypothetical protein
MANYAVLDANNVVTNVIVADTLEIAQQVSKSTNCIELKETHFPDFGKIYNAELDRFIKPQPYDGAVLSPVGIWVPPISKPDSGLWEWVDGSWSEKERFPQKVTQLAVTAGIHSADQITSSSPVVNSAQAVQAMQSISPTPEVWVGSPKSAELLAAYLASQGVQGTQTTQGVQGTQGIQGMQGTQGIQGATNG